MPWDSPTAFPLPLVHLAPLFPALQASATHEGRMEFGLGMRWEWDERWDGSGMRNGWEMNWELGWEMGSVMGWEWDGSRMRHGMGDGMGIGWEMG